jgi:four helix bundle protein
MSKKTTSTPESRRAKPQLRSAQTRSFQDLEAWQISREVRRRMSPLAKRLPRNEKFALADQLVRASRSATANLAEGYGRYQYPDMVRFARQARGSLYEVLDHLTVALDEGYITKATFEEESEHVFRPIQVVNGFIRFLRRRQKESED